MMIQNPFSKPTSIIQYLLCSVLFITLSFEAQGNGPQETASANEQQETAPASKQQEPQYTVIDGKVDKSTFNGYRRFHGICHTCHGPNATGSTFAPSLVESLKTITYEEFSKTLKEGRQVTNPDGSSSAMPSFKENTDIMKFMDDIYKFLKARSDGVLPGGRPKKIPK